jgi:hypothetical protein
MNDDDFAVLIKRSRQVEQEIMKWYQKNVDPKTRLANPSTKEYDLVCPEVGNVEIKEDFIATRSDQYALEYEDANGKPSGIACTTAGEFIIVDKEYVLRIATISLLFLVKECPDRRIIQMGYTTKEGKRAIGYLIPRNYLIHSPYVECLERWF